MQKLKFIKLIITSLLLLGTQTTVASDLFSPYFEQIQFNNIDPEYHPIHPSVITIEQDADGFIWFGTQDGLDRFDGYDFKHYNVDVRRNNGLVNNWIKDIHTDREGRLWIASKGGINLFVPETESFEWFDTSTGFPIPTQTEITQIAEQTNNMLWFASSNGSAFKLDMSTKKIIEYSSANAERYLPADTINSMYIDNDDSLVLIMLSHGIYRFNETLQQFEADPVSKDPLLIGAEIKYYFQGHNDYVWLTTDIGLFYSDPERQGLIQVKGQSELLTTECSAKIHAIQEDNLNRLWLGTEKGLCGYDPKENKFYRYQTNESKRSSLIENRVRSLFSDQGGVMWVGTMGGVSRWNTNIKSFTHISKDFGSTPLLNENLVTSFAYDEASNNTYVGTWRGGVSIINAATGYTDKITQNTIEGFDDDRVMSLLSDTQSKLWIGTFDHGAYRFDPESKQLINYRQNANTNLKQVPISSNSVSKIIQLANGNVVVATYGGGINIIDANNNVEHIGESASAAKRLSSNKVLDVIEDEFNNLWVATDGGGISVIDTKRATTTVFYKNIPNNQIDTNKRELLTNHVFSLYEGKRYIYFGTQDIGLARIDKAAFLQPDNTIQYLDIKDGLASNSIYGILEDAEFNLWISHSKGLSKVTSDFEKVKNFTRDHGLQGRDFTAGAFYQTNSGRMFFGGNNGFNTFLPAQLKESSFNPPIRLNRFAVANNNVPLYSMFNSQGEVELKHTETVFSFSFSALDFTQPQENKYEYMLEGLHQEFIDNGHQRTVTFTQVPDGRYTLKIRGSNSDGQFSSNEISIPLKILPPVYRSPVAYLFYTVIVMLTILYTIFLYRDKMRRQIAFQQELRQKVDERTSELATTNKKLNFAMNEAQDARLVAESAAKAKSTFLATISHEIRTPMNSILGMGELLLNTDLNSLQQRYAQSAHKSGRMLLAMINEILDFSKLEMEKVVLEKITFDLPKHIEESAFLVAPKLSDYAVDFVVLIDKETPQWVIGDPTRLQQIINNLLSNAIKFTQAGKVTLSVGAKAGLISIVVKDSGIGMSTKQLARVFEPFEQADTSTTREFGGTGLGLSITNTLVALMGGNIRVESQANVGTSFFVEIPFVIDTDKSNQGQRALTLSDEKISILIGDKDLHKCVSNCLDRLTLNYTTVDFNQIDAEQAHNTILLIDAHDIQQTLLSNLTFHEDCKIIIIHAKQAGLTVSDCSNLFGCKKANIHFLDVPVISEHLATLINMSADNVSLSPVVESALKYGKTHHIKAKLLLVDDSETNRQVAHEMLTLLGASADFAENGKSAVKMAAIGDYDLIFMDCNMPIMDGYEATRLIRMQEASSNKATTPIVALTAGLGGDFEEKCLSCGMNSVILKPYSAEALLASIKENIAHLIEQRPKAIATANNKSKQQEAKLTPNNRHYEYINLDTLNTIKEIEQQTTRQIYPKIVKIFRQELTIKVDLMNKAIEIPDYAILSVHAHSLKSIAGNIGAFRIEDMCVQLQVAANAENAKLCSEIIISFPRCIELTNESIERIIANDY